MFPNKGAVGILLGAIRIYYFRTWLTLLCWGHQNLWSVEVGHATKKEVGKHCVRQSSQPSPLPASSFDCKRALTSSKVQNWEVSQGLDQFQLCIVESASYSWHDNPRLHVSNCSYKLEETRAMLGTCGREENACANLKTTSRIISERKEWNTGEII